MTSHGEFLDALVGDFEELDESSCGVQQTLHVADVAAQLQTLSLFGVHLRPGDAQVEMLSDELVALGEFDNQVIDERALLHLAAEFVDLGLKPGCPLPVLKVLVDVL